MQQLIAECVCVRLCTIGPKKKNTPIFPVIYYRRKMEFIPFNMDYYLLQFDALKFFLRVRQHGRRGGGFFYLTLIFSL